MQLGGTHNRRHNKPRLRRRIVTGVSIMAALVLSAVNANGQRDFSKVRIRTTPLGGGVAMLEGAGGNLGVSVGPDGVLLVDDQFGPLTEKIRAAIGELSSEPVRFVLNTHWHGDHSGGNENFGRGGAVILAHSAVRARMGSDQYSAFGDVTIPASPGPALPVVTFEDGIRFHINGQTIAVHHVASAHTDGDSIVHFREADVLHLGDTYFMGRYPYIDLSSGGGIDGMIAASNRALELAGPKTRIIPGHGKLSNRAELLSYRDMLVTIRDRVRKRVDGGESVEEVVSSRPTKDFDAAFGGGFIKSDDFTRTVYESLSLDRDGH